MKLFPIYSQKVEYLKILRSDIFPYQFTNLTHYNITWNTLQPKGRLTNNTCVNTVHISTLRRL